MWHPDKLLIVVLFISVGEKEVWSGRDASARTRSCFSAISAASIGVVVTLVNDQRKLEFELLLDKMDKVKRTFQMIIGYSYKTKDNFNYLL